MNKNITINKDIMIDDLFNIIDLVKAGRLSEESFCSVLEKYSWYLTERVFINDKNYPAKYKGCLNWSCKALNQFKDTKSDSGLIHEHVIPKSIFVNSMKELLKKPFTEAERKQYAIQIKDCFFACIVTKEEANELDKIFKNCMPSGENNFFKIEKIWERYDRCNINHVEVKWKKNGDINTIWSIEESL